MMALGLFAKILARWSPPSRVVRHPSSSARIGPRGNFGRVRLTSDLVRFRKKSGGDGRTLAGAMTG